MTSCHSLIGGMITPLLWSIMVIGGCAEETYDCASYSDDVPETQSPCHELIEATTRWDGVYECADPWRTPTDCTLYEIYDEVYAPSGVYCVDKRDLMQRCRRNNCPVHHGVLSALCSVPPDPRH